MSDTPKDELVVEADHLVVEPYAERERVIPPKWYDDDINVGDEANRDADS